MYALALAIVTMTAGAQAQPDTPSRLAELASQARKLQLDGQRSDAIVLYRQILAQDPRSADAHMGMGESLDLEGKFSEARQHIQKGIELSPDEDVNAALSAMGVSYAFEANAAEAAKYYQRAFDRQVKAGALESAGGIANAIGRVYLETGDHANAEKWYRTGYESANKVPGRTPAQTDLTEMRWHHAQARIAARRKQFDVARKHVDEVRAIVERGQLGASQRVNLSARRGLRRVLPGQHGSRDRGAVEGGSGRSVHPQPAGAGVRAEKGSGKARELYAKIMSQSTHSLQMAFARPLAGRRLAGTQ